MVHDADACAGKGNYMKRDVLVIALADLPSPRHILRGDLEELRPSAQVKLPRNLAWVKLSLQMVHQTRVSWEKISRVESWLHHL